MIRKILTTALIGASLISHSSVAQESTDPEALFEEAMQYREDGELFSAIEIFETILSNQPELNRARLELAVSYHLTRRYEAARAELNRVLNDPDTPESVELTITAYLAQLSGDMQAAQQRSRSSIYLSVGLFSDSNINLGPDSQTIDQELLSPVIREKNSHGGQILLSVSNRSRASQPLDIAGRAVDFEWLTQATAFNKSYAADAGDSDFNLSVLSLTTGPALIADRAWRTALNIKMDKLFFGNDPYAVYQGFNPLFTYSIMQDLELTLENTTTIKEYEDKSLDDTLKGTATSWGMDLAKFYSKLNIGMQAGIKRHDNGAEASFRHYTGTEIYLGGQMPAWENARAYLTVSSRDYKYKGADTDAGFTESRDETELLTVLGVNHNFTSGDFKSWTLNAQATYADNDSNLDAFDYDRTQVEVNMRRYFF
jgi:tetratricopeptide (TPR) repeat protein